MRLSNLWCIATALFVSALHAQSATAVDNASVRILTAVDRPHQKTAVHEHVGAGRAVVLLTPLAGRVEAPNRQAAPMSGGPGDVFWTDGPIKHRGSNIGNRPSELVIVEVK